MEHAYYQYSEQELIENQPKFPLIIIDEKEAVFEALADQMISIIKAHNDMNKTTVFIVPVGPVGQYPYFVSRVNQEKVSLKKVWFINMDEYLDDNKQYIPLDHPLSFRGFMDREVYSRIDADLVMPEEQRVFPDPEHPERIGELIEKLGGVDACFGGIGINGHIAFNEADPSLSPEEFLDLPTRVMPISQETRAANAIGDFGGKLEDMPKWCVTIGMREIKKSAKIRLGCFREWHRAVVRRACYGERTSDFPVTLLRDHADISLRISRFVAQKPEV